MAVSDIFSVAAGAMALLAQMYLTYWILGSCRFSSFFVVMQACMAVLYLVYASLVVGETQAELGIGYLVFQMCLTGLMVLNVFLMYTKSCPLGGWRKRLYDFLESVGQTMQPVTSVFQAKCDVCTVTKP